MEAGLKLARQYFVEIGEPQRRHVIARLQSYHGNTLGALSTGGNLWRRQQFEPLLVDVSHVSPCYAYRGKRPGETDAAYGERLVAELEAEVARLGPRNVIAFVAETVVGATLGAVPPVPGYFRGIRELCDRHGILLILDEVITGFRFAPGGAQEYYGIDPDLSTFAKAMANGATIGAFGGRRDIMELLATAEVRHAGTYNAALVPLAAARATLARLSENDNAAYTYRRLIEERQQYATGENPVWWLLAGEGNWQATLRTAANTVWRATSARDRAVQQKANTHALRTALETATPLSKDAEKAFATISMNTRGVQPLSPAEKKDRWGADERAVVALVSSEEHGFAMGQTARQAINARGGQPRAAHQQRAAAETVASAGGVRGTGARIVGICGLAHACCCLAKGR